MVRVKATPLPPGEDHDSGPQLRIVSVSVFGGFLDGLRLALPPALTCIIGPRGAGKSTALELVRYALDLVDSNDRKRIEAMVDHNLENGRVEVQIETREGLKYVVSRVAGNPPEVLTHDMRPTKLSIGTGVLFRAKVVSQGGMEAIADSAEVQRALLDGFDPEKLATVATELNLIHESLDQNAVQLQMVGERLAELSDEVGLLKDVDEKLRQFEAPNSAEHKRFTAATTEKTQRDAEQREMAASLAAVAQWQARFKAVRQELAGRTPPKPAGPAGPNRAAIEEFREVSRALRDVVIHLLDSADQRLADGQQRLAGIASQLEQTHKVQELDYRKFIESHEQLQAKSAERVRLQKRREELNARATEHAEVSRNRQELLAHREGLLARLAELQDERFRTRQAIVKRINAELSPTIRVQMQQFGDRGRYRDFVAEVLRSSGRFKHAAMAQRITDALGPGELAAAARQRDVKVLVTSANITQDQAEKVASALAEELILLKLEGMPQDDLASIELQDGQDYKDSTELSKGQKCTAILPILLLEQNYPLLIDQPEDNLDNRFIYQTIVEGIRRVKDRRQLIFVTHNPNIPVLGDAEQVFVLESDGRRAEVAQSGTVDECQARIVELLEGGEEAFKLRQSRYHY